MKYFNNETLKIYLGGSFILILIFFIISCNRNQPNLGIVQNDDTVLDSVPLFHLTKNVQIPISGKLKAWEKYEVTLPDSSYLVSVLYEKGDFIKKGAVLASFWPYRRKSDYTPIDIAAPISGFITSEHCRVENVVTSEFSIMTIKNYYRLLLQSNVSQANLDIIKYRQKVKISFMGKQLWGIVAKINKIGKRVNIFIDNQRLKYEIGKPVKGYIECGRIKGDYLAARYFNHSDSLKIHLNDNIDLTLRRCGIAGSLDLVSPSLPDQNYLKIIKKNLDLSN